MGRIWDRRTMKPRILLIDDEPAVLAGYERTLRQDFDVQTAVGGELGLKALREDAPYAVVVSDSLIDHELTVLAPL
jgi:DNA-binding NtrC family response regulator